MPLTSVKGSWLPVNLAKLILARPFIPLLLAQVVKESLHYTELQIFHPVIFTYWSYLYTGATESPGILPLQKEERQYIYFPQSISFSKNCFSEHNFQGFLNSEISLFKENFNTLFMARYEPRWGLINSCFDMDTCLNILLMIIFF